MIGKLLIVVIIGALIYFLFIKKRDKIDGSKKVEELVPCEKCGTFVSPNEAVISSGKFFCSKECATR